MLFAIMSCVSATRSLERAAASSAFIPSSAIQCSSQTQRRERAPPGAELLQEPRRRRSGVSGGGLIDELVERRAQRAASVLVAARDARGPLVRRLQLVEPLHRAQRHAPHALDQPQPQHRGNRPQLADGQRRDLLEGAHEQVDVVEIDPRLGVRDQRDRDLVDARIAGERCRSPAPAAPGSSPAGRLSRTSRMCSCTTWKLSSSHSPAGPTSTLAVRGRREPLVGLVEDPAGLVQPDQEAGAPPRGLGGHALGARERARALGEMLGAEQLAADGAGEELFGSGGGSRRRSGTSEARSDGH